MLWAVALWATAARGQSLPEARGASVEWVAPRECADSAALRGEVERLLGRALDTAVERPVQARGRVSHADERWHLELDLTQDGLSRRRVLEGESCRALLEAAGVVIALAIDPALVQSAPLDAVRSASPSEPAGSRPNSATTVAAPESEQPPPRPTPQPTSVVSAPRVPEPMRSTSPALRPSLGVLAALDGWALPRVAGGLEVRGAVTLGHWQVGLLASLLSSPSVTIREGATARFWSGGAQLSTAYLARTEPWTVAPFVALGADRIWGSTVGLTDDGSGQSTWWTAGPGLAIKRTLGQGFSAESGATLLAGFGRKVFRIEGIARSAHQTPELTLRGHFGLEVQFR
jgi:hypothetical protein